MLPGSYKFRLSIFLSIKLYFSAAPTLLPEDEKAQRISKNCWRQGCSSIWLFRVQRLARNQRYQPSKCSHKASVGTDNTTRQQSVPPAPNYQMIFMHPQTCHQTSQAIQSKSSNYTNSFTKCKKTTILFRSWQKRVISLLFIFLIGHFQSLFSLMALHRICKNTTNQESLKWLRFNLPNASKSFKSHI